MDATFGLQPTLAACALCCSVLIVSGCSEDDPFAATQRSSVAQTSDVVLAGQRAGPTPFVAYLDLAGVNINALLGVSYEIAPMPGAASAPVHVDYTIQSLRNKGWVNVNTVTLPVFGLYAGSNNVATVELRYYDNSIQTISAPIATPPYQAAGALAAPIAAAPRARGTALGFDYMALKPGQVGPVTILDSDGAIRWVSTLEAQQAVQFTNNGFLIGSPDGSALSREELDGRVTTASLASLSFTLFHHDISSGPQGALIAPDTEDRTEDLLFEIRPDGTVVRSWDLVQIFADFMRAQGDDPDEFARAGVDWFHLNSALYDPSDNSLIISSRENFVVKIGYDTSEIKWILGDPQKHWYSYPSLRSKALALPPGALVPIGQHALSFTPAGELMMFNNGEASLNNPAGTPAGASRSFSAVTAFSIDPVARTARPGFVFEDMQGIYSGFCSSAYFAPDGSLLITYSDSAAGMRIKGLDPARRVVFDYTYDGGCNTAWNAVIVPLEDMRFTD